MFQNWRQFRKFDSVRVIICNVVFIYLFIFFFHCFTIVIAALFVYILFFYLHVYAFVKNVTRNDQFILNFLFPVTYSVYIYSFSKSKIKEIVARLKNVQYRISFRVTNYHQKFQIDFPAPVCKWLQLRPRSTSRSRGFARVSRNRIFARPGNSNCSRAGWERKRIEKSPS